VERTRRLGQPIEFAEQGLRRVVQGGAELAAYRVVQEALTNAVKHAPGRPTVVRVDHDGEAVAVEVTTAGGPGAGRRDVASTGGGRGLVGLAERVRVVGGELRAGTLPTGGFEVRARIPFETARAGAVAG
jgi:signal transduction histidine kinase